MGNLPAGRAGEFEIDCLDRLDASTDDYAQLFAESGATAFQHPLWLERLYATLAPALAAKPVIVRGRRSDGELLFFLPLVLRKVGPLRIIEPADLGVGDYNAPVLSRKAERILRSTPDLAERIRKILPPHDLLSIRHIRSEHLELWSLFFPQPATRQDYSAHEIVLAGDHDSWKVAALDDKFRRYLDRKVRRFFREGNVTLDEIADPAGAAQAMRDLAAIRKGRFEGDLLQKGFVQDFYSEFATASAASGLARAFALRLDGSVVGLILGIALRQRFHLILIACDYENHGRHSPGLVFVDMLIRARREAGDTVFDLTVGDEPYKSDFAGQPQALYLIEGPGSVLGRLALAAMALKRTIRARIGRAQHTYRRWGQD